MIVDRDRRLFAGGALLGLVGRSGKGHIAQSQALELQCRLLTYFDWDLMVGNDFYGV